MTTKNRIDAYTTPADPKLSALVLEALSAYHEWIESEDELEAELIGTAHPYEVTPEFKNAIAQGVSSLSDWLGDRVAVTSRVGALTIE